MKIMLNVPYAEKDEAKQLGAKFDWQAKTWYCDNLNNIKLFSKWLDGTNILCENLYILQMNRECYRCGKKFEVLLLATDRSYALEDDYQLNTNTQNINLFEMDAQKTSRLFRRFALLSILFKNG